MAKFKVYLGIGYPTTTHEDVIDVDDDQLAACKTEKEKEDLLHEYWTDWSGNYIEGNIVEAEGK